MPADDDSLYFQYLKAFAVVQSGGQLSSNEFSGSGVTGNTPAAVALALGAQDGKNRTESKGQKELLQAISKMRA